MKSWKWINGWKGRYKISSSGDIKCYYSDNRDCTTPIVKKLVVNKFGYKRVTLTINAKRSNHQVHRLVAEAFIPNLEGKPCVNHKDGNKENNNVGNLEWCTQSENVIHAFKTGLRHGISGEINGMAKLNEHQVKRIRLMKEINPMLSNKIIAKMFGVCRATVGLIAQRKLWAHI